MAKRKCPECKTNIGPNGYCFSCKKTTADNIMKKASTELRFASEGEALQYLSDVTGKKIKIAFETLADKDKKEQVKFFENLLKNLLLKLTEAKDELEKFENKDDYDFSDMLGEYRDFLNKLEDEAKSQLNNVIQHF
jgi:hypothetical protein